MGIPRTSWVYKISAFLGKTVFPWQVKKVLLSGVFGLFQAPASSMVLNAKFGCLVSNCFFVFLASSWSRGQTQPKLDWIEGLETRNIVLVNFSKWHHTNSKELTTSTAAPEWIYWWWPSTWQRAPFRVLGSRTLKTFKLRMKGDERILIRILFFYEKLPNALELEGFFGSGKVFFDLDLVIFWPDCPTNFPCLITNRTRKW